MIRQRISRLGPSFFLRLGYGFAETSGRSFQRLD